MTNKRLLEGGLLAVVVAVTVLWSARNREQVPEPVLAPERTADLPSDRRTCDVQYTLWDEPGDPWRSGWDIELVGHVRDHERFTHVEAIVRAHADGPPILLIPYHGHGEVIGGGGSFRISEWKKRWGPSLHLTFNCWEARGR